MIRTGRYYLIWALAIPGLLAFPVTSSATQPVGKCCQGLANADATVRKLMQAPPAPGNLGAWKSQYAAYLAQVRGLCPAAAQTRLDGVIKFVQRLSYQSPDGQPVYVGKVERGKKFARISLELDEVRTAAACTPAGKPTLSGSATAGSKSTTMKGVCAGKAVKSSSDEGAAKTFLTDQLKAAGETLVEDTKLGAVLEKKAKAEKYWGFWQQVQAAGCLPGKVRQSLHLYVRDKQSSGDTTAACNSLCGATADWVVELTGDSRIRNQFFKACGLRCE